MSLERLIILLLSKKTVITSKEFISLLADLSFTSQSIRNSLTKLKKLAYITSTERASYTLTDKGIKANNGYRMKDNYYNIKWNGKWLIILIGIPETLRSKRDYFRNFLLNIGFGYLYKSVYVFPWNISNQLFDIIDTLEIEEYLTISISQEFILNKISAEGISSSNSVRRLWNIDEIHNKYEEKQIWLEENQKLINTSIYEKQQYHSLLFSRYLSLIVLQEEFINQDPMLPPEFLPGNWLGTKVLHDIDQQITYIEKILSTDNYYSLYISNEINQNFKTRS
ncbi:PaaX family transcriptional regulator C-terminal domain-containing protein [Alkalihalobacillus pseudalcaliphilus]|uniref:PaaX family transcriptional regulator C-terminal domain-containing protein n=1 Tax=Alkalihalobacillus pseudalcaliphilus TaxID=79884 RepID=UPI00064E1414|nr:PaaX family transcriptional regulator C-terminal domain-containing protein [Alkalihalobacillus pseudalcaliphilus]KMK76082.1 hypothetical protein AB990_12700 [Alkalihalobacillus pseudalcaliphilus]